MVTGDEPRLPASVRRLVPPVAGLPLGPMLTVSLRALARRRPGVFDRLGPHRRASYLINPVDLPFAFMVVPDGEEATVRIFASDRAPPSDVVIRGPLLMLLGLLDGTYDGDALFFHRAVSMNGQTEAVVALRNAIEDAELRPADLLALRGQAGEIADRGILGAIDLARRILTREANSREERA